MTDNKYIYLLADNGHRYRFNKAAVTFETTSVYDRKEDDWQRISPTDALLVELFSKITIVTDN